MTETIETKQKESTFTKRQLINSRKYMRERDVLSALLKDDQPYTISEVDTIVQTFLKGKKGRRKG